MKKRKLFQVCVVSALMILFLAGCVQQGDPTGTDPEETKGSSGTNIDPEGNNGAQNGTTGPNLTNIAPESPENPGNSLISYDPDRELFILCQNINISFNNYTRMTFGFDIPILSKTPLDPSQISLELNTDYEYEVMVFETSTDSLWQTEITAGSAQTATFNYYLYQCYRGTDFSAIAAKYLEMEIAQEVYREDPTNENFQKALALESQYLKMLDTELTAFQALTGDQIPHFYVYTLSVIFEQLCEEREVITEAKFTIGDTTYTEPVSIVLEPDLPDIHYPWATGINSGMFMGYRPNLYSGGYATDIPFMFTSPVDMIVTDLYIMRDVGQIKETRVTIESNGMKMDFYWDGEEPLLICKGDKVQIMIYFQSDIIDGISYAVNLQVGMDCEVDGKMVSYVSDVLLCSDIGQNYHDLYAIIFEGLDMEDYWNYYFHGREPWREKYME